MTTAVAAKSDPGQTLNNLINVTKPTSGNQTEDRFLKLLVTQMRNQDPLNPLDNAQVTSQIAQINTVSGIEKLNASFAGFSASLLSTQALQASSMIGHGVLAAGHSVQLNNGHAFGGALLKEPADDVVVSITTLAGDAVQTLHLGPREAGSMMFDWDGMRTTGGAATPGNYSFKVTATRGTQALDVAPLAYATVRSVGINANELSLQTDTLGAIAISDVKQIL